MLSFLRTAARTCPVTPLHRRRVIAASALALACAGGRVDSEAQVASVGFVAVVPGSATLAIGDSVLLEAVVLGSAGDTLQDPAVEWRSANSSIAPISPAGYVRAVAPGLAGITAESGGRVGSARVIVIPAGTPARVAAAPSTPEPQPVRPPSAQVAQPAAPPAQRPSRAAPQGAGPNRLPMSEEAVQRRRDGSAHPNEPRGFRPLADRAFLTKAKSDDDRGDKACRGGSE